MTDTTNNTKRPTHIVYVVVGEEPKARWHRIGAAWQNRDRKGFNVVLDSLPLDGRMVIREASEDKNEVQS